MHLLYKVVIAICKITEFGIYVWERLPIISLLIVTVVRCKSAKASICGFEEKEPRRWHYGILARRPLLVVVLVSIIQYRPMTEKRS